MADSKITALTALTAADPVNDMFPVVDVSDTSMAASGTTKRISVNNILGASGTATLASATIAGDLTVDTSTLKVDSTNNTVGIGNATPPTGASNTDIGLTLGAAGTVRSVLVGMQNCFGRIRERDAVNNLAITTNIGATGTIDDNTRSSWKIRIGSGNDNYVVQRAAIASSTFNDLLAIDSGGVCVWSDGAGGTRMTLNSTGLAVANGNVILSTSGKGIDFSATANSSGTMTSELLNDYEEGTWTAGVSFGGNAVGVAYTATSGQYGLYTKIGNRVYWSCAISLTNKGSSTGALKITGLPFASQGVISYNEAQVIAYFENFVGLTGALNARISNSGTTVDITQSTATTCSAITNTFVSNTTYITASGSYAV